MPPLPGASFGRRRSFTQRAVVAVELRVAVGLPYTRGMVTSSPTPVCIHTKGEKAKMSSQGLVRRYSVWWVGRVGRSSVPQRLEPRWT